MRLMTALLTALMACGPLEAPPEMPTHQAPANNPQPEYLPVDTAVTLEIGADAGADEVSLGSQGQICARRRARMEEFQRELVIAEEEFARYVSDRCEPTMKHRTQVGISGGQASDRPERAWICDGKLVDKLESVRGQWLVVRIADLRDYLREHCT